MQLPTIETLERRKRELLEQLQVCDLQTISKHSRADDVPDDVDACSDVHRDVALIERLARGELAIERGNAITQAEARIRLARWLS